MFLFLLIPGKLIGKRAYTPPYPFIIVIQGDFFLSRSNDFFFRSIIRKSEIIRSFFNHCGII